MALHNRYEDEPVEGQEPLRTDGFHKDAGVNEEAGNLKVDAAGYVGRVGMDKNFRVGKVKFITSKSFESDDKSKPSQHILIDVIETAYTKLGEKYPAGYNLWLAVPQTYRGNLMNIVGKYCLVGFYITSLRRADQNATYDTHLLLKYFSVLTQAEAERVADELHTTKHILK